MIVEAPPGVASGLEPTVFSRDELVISSEDVLDFDDVPEDDASLLIG